MIKDKKKYHREYMVKWRKHNKENRLCISCKTPLHKNYKYQYCKKCLKICSGYRKKTYFNNPQKESFRGSVKNFSYKFLALKKINKNKKPKCVKCGNEDLRILTINHKKNKDKEDKKSFYIKIVKGKRKTEDLEVRCYNCNILYEYERKKLIFPKREINKKLKEWGEKI